MFTRTPKVGAKRIYLRGKVPGTCAELQYAAITGDCSRVDEAIRQLNWATYMVNEKGWNRYPLDDIWFTDGYGDYVRHYLRAMAAKPDLAPAESHILASNGIKRVEYTMQDGFNHVYYEAVEPSGIEIVRLSSKPKVIWKVNNRRSIIFPDHITHDDAMVTFEEGEAAPGASLSWTWTECKKGGYVTINRADALIVEIKN